MDLRYMFAFCFSGLSRITNILKSTTIHTEMGATSICHEWHLPYLPCFTHDMFTLTFPSGPFTSNVHEQIRPRIWWGISCLIFSRAEGAWMLLCSICAILLSPCRLTTVKLLTKVNPSVGQHEMIWLVVVYYKLLSILQSITDLQKEKHPWHIF